MSGNAIIPLMAQLGQHPENKIRKLFIGKISDADFDSLFPDRFGVFPKANDQSFIGRLLFELGSKGLIDTSYSPKFILGSTRLAALKNYGKDAIWTDKLETDDIIQMASGKKTEFGDFDIDIILKGSKQDIVDVINRIDPSKFIARVTNEVNVAIRMGDKVIQCDLVDISKATEATKFLQKSGFVDLAANVKGVFSIYLLRAVAANMDVSAADALEAVLDFANKDPSSSFSKTLQKKIQHGYKPKRVRFSLGAFGLKLVVDLSKDIDGSEKVEKLDTDINPRVDYKNLDALAKQILQDTSATASDIFHAISLAKFIRDRKPLKATKIWEDFVKASERNIKSGIDEKDYEAGMTEIGNFLNKGSKNSIKEGREAIGRFEGKNQFSNTSFFELLYNIITETGNQGKDQFEIDLKNNRVIDMIEKMDSTFCNFGIDRNGKFFMESSNSGPVYEQTATNRFGFNKDLLESFKDLNNDARFQSSLKKLFRSIGPFKYDAELFPVLTHQGNENGDIIFVATKYRKEKFGNKGGLVVFKVNLWNDLSLSWYRPDVEQNIQAINLIRHEADSSGWSKDWKVYTNEKDMKMAGIVNINVGRYLSSYFSSSHMYERGQLELKSRKKSSEKEQIIIELDKIRTELQVALDGFANNANSVLGGRNSSIEGVILRIKTPAGDIYEVKGTSATFDNQKEILWHDRAAILNLENDFESRFIKNVLRLKTAQPASLNKTISLAADEFTSKTRGMNKKVEFIHFLLPRLTSDNIDFDMTKSSAMTLLDETERIYTSLLQNFKMNEQSLDIDSIRKTEDFFSAFKNKFKTYEALTKSSSNGSDYYVRLLDSIIGFRIDKFINTSEEKENAEDLKREKVIIWSGRAQPWHKGHDAMIKKGKTFLKQAGASKILIMIVKGAESSKNVDNNPLSEKEQATLLYSIYKNDPEVEIYGKFPKSGFLLELMEHITTTGYVISGWLAGADRISEYKKSIVTFKPSLFKETHDYSPIQLDSIGNPLFQMIETPRIMSGTETREMAKTTNFKTWVERFAPDDIDESTIGVYKTIYNKIKGESQESLSETALSKEAEVVNEISATSAGSITGGPNMNREDFLEEIKLRKFIKETLRLQEKKKSSDLMDILNEEQKLRQVVKKMILKEKEEDRPHHSTGINVLSDLLKKIVPVLEIDYKKMTSHPMQRQSFRAHILKACTNALATENSSDEADEQSTGKKQAGMQDSDLAEAEINLDVDNNEQDSSEQNKFIDIKRPSEKKTQQQKPDPKKLFGIEGEDETGRNISMSSFDKIETSIIDSYQILSDPEDKRLFYDYLITNLGLYFKKFEDELKSNIEEPVTDSGKKQRDLPPPTGGI